VAVKVIGTLVRYQPLTQLAEAQVMAVTGAVVSVAVATCTSWDRATSWFPALSTDAYLTVVVCEMGIAEP
jgi:hypothetical protein